MTLTPTEYTVEQVSKRNECNAYYEEFKAVSKIVKIVYLVHISD
jgi:hypothetical protein